ncbi:MAG: diguanylate cyclase [Nitrospinae bacterium]|nr:diguanylate cyclase [Nitrospinota bacterium]
MLLVDDEEVVRKSLTRLLENDGYAVTASASGEEALNHVRSTSFDVLLCDYKMPGMNGLETCAAAKTLRPDMACILITGAGSDQVIIEAFTMGKVDHYLAKPFSGDELRNAMSYGLKEAGSRYMTRRFGEELRRKVEEATGELLEKNRLLRQREQEAAALNQKLQEEHERLLKLNEKLGTLSVTDGLTSLFNFRHFTNRLAEEFYRARRYGGALSLLMIDLDDFKPVNDVFGHLAGDEVLKSIADILRTSSRTADLAARYGGEEFAMVLPEVGLDGAALSAERLRQGIAEMSVNFSGAQIKVTASIGVAALDSGSMNAPQDLVKSADLALYHAKETGKNCVAILRDGQVRAMGKENIITEGSRAGIHAVLDKMTMEAESAEEVAGYFTKALKDAFTDNGSEFYISVRIAGPSGEMMERASMGSYSGFHDLQTLARETAHNRVPKIYDDPKDPLSAFPVLSGGKTAEGAGLTGALLLNRIPSSLGFLSRLAADLGEALCAVEERRQAKDLINRREALDALLGDTAGDASNEEDWWAPLKKRGDRLKEILGARGVWVYTFNPPGVSLSLESGEAVTAPLARKPDASGSVAERVFHRMSTGTTVLRRREPELEEAFALTGLAMPSLPAAIRPLWGAGHLWGALVLTEPYGGAFAGGIEDLVEALCPTLLFMIYNERRQINGKTSTERKNA